LYPEKVWTESAAFDTSFAASAVEDLRPVDLSYLSGSRPKTLQFDEEDELQYRRNLQVIPNEFV